MNKEKIAIFDLDYTILKTDSTILFLKEIIKLYPKFLIYLILMMLYAFLHLLKIINRTKFKEIVYKPLETLSSNQFNEFSVHLAKICLNYIKEGALKEIKKLQKKGFILIIATASPEFYVKLIAKHLNIKYFVGTKIIFVNNKLKIDGVNCKKEEKLKRLSLVINLEEVDLKNSFAYSDSYSDMPILKLVGNAYLVNKKKWLIKKKIDNNHFSLPR